MDGTNSIFGGLTLSLCVYSAKISVKDLNYIELGEKFTPNEKIVAINSNFIHNAYNGFEEFISKPKKITYYKKKLMATAGYKERKKVGDGTCFGSCLEFIIFIDKPYKTRYFPKSGDLQVFGVTDEKYRSGEIVADCFINYLKKSLNLDSIEIISTYLSLVNYKFDVLLPDKFLIDLTKLGAIINSKQYQSPFPIHFTNVCIDGRKLSVIFKINDKKTRFIIWPSGRVNIMSAVNFDNASRIYEFFLGVFEAEWKSIIKALPISNKDQIVSSAKKCMS
jgi:hypothetical protein